MIVDRDNALVPVNLSRNMPGRPHDDNLGNRVRKYGCIGPPVKLDRCGLKRNSRAHREDLLISDRFRTEAAYPAGVIALVAPDIPRQRSLGSKGSGHAKAILDGSAKRSAGSRSQIRGLAAQSSLSNHDRNLTFEGVGTKTTSKRASDE